MIERIKYILKHYGLSASQFADKINVPRSSISHIISGRNKPSLDFIIKVENKFKDISLDWLIKGYGDLENKFTDVKQPKHNNYDNKKIKKIIIFYEDNTFEYFNS